MTDVSLDEALRHWDRLGIRIELEKEAGQRQELNSRFPLEAWPEMPLEKYALGQDTTDTFCWWLEFGTPLAGSIRGGTAKKLLIYKRKNDPGWYFDSTSYSDEGAAWTDIRKGFLTAFRLAAENRFEEIDSISVLYGAQVLRVKATYVYFPDGLLPIASKAHLDHFLERLDAKVPGEDVITANRRLLAVLRNVDGLADFTTKELERLLYWWSPPPSATKIVKIAPGPDASQWKDCLEGGYICVGWDELGDLRDYPSWEAFRHRFGELFPYEGNLSQVTRKAKEVWTLVELQPGDLVVANRGTSEILGVGTVTDEAYRWRPERAEFRNTVTVEWDTSKARRIAPVKAWATVTVRSITDGQYAELMRDAAVPTPEPNGEIAPDELLLRIAAALEGKGQVILYGPPGTGKTYYARRFAKWWLSHGPASTGLIEPAPETSAASPRSGSGDAISRLTFVTFHPSYGYEDFIEGFRPVQSGNATGLHLELRDGVFKNVCRAATADPENRYLLLIDEINRGNVPRIFGELITLLELDKRDVEVTLPQSGQTFSVPGNVYIVATMNTADRSIHLLDAALRRRFAFIELLPDPDTLEGLYLGPLSLSVFLTELNRRVLTVAGRERQVGHALLFTPTGDPVGSAEEFGLAFRHEILPLLQEYVYEDYTQLASVLGKEVIDAEAQTPRWDVVLDDAALVETIAKEFGTKPAVDAEP